MDVSVNKGLSGAPVLIKESNQYKLVGMVTCTIGENKNYTVALNNYSIKTVVTSIINNFNESNVYYQNDLLRYNIYIKQGLTKKWLGIFGYYNDPINIRQKNSSLINLKYNGGLVITKFILGFDFVKEKYVYETDSLIKGSVIPINGPLLESKIYERYIESNKQPIVIKSMTFYDAIKIQYYKFNIGKYSNQNGFFRFNYGFLPLGNFPLDLQNI